MQRRATDLVEGEQSEIDHLRGVVDRLRHAATHDPLTGLPTREVLLGRLQRELGRTEAGAEHRGDVSAAHLPDRSL